MNCRPGRTPISTHVIAEDRREEVMARIRLACQQGWQVYWVCPLINESEAISCQAATKTAEHLQQSLTDLNIGLIHGRMRSEEKEVAMSAFRARQYSLAGCNHRHRSWCGRAKCKCNGDRKCRASRPLTATSIAHGVGRGSVASYCILLYQHPLSELAKARLSVMRTTTDGFQIAQRDLELH